MNYNFNSEGFCYALTSNKRSTHWNKLIEALSIRHDAKLLKKNSGELKKKKKRKDPRYNIM